MSNDLISRKETERLLRAYADEVGCNRGEYELANGILKAACFLQNEENIPTAYNVDNVVERLEDERNPMYRMDGSKMAENRLIEIDKAVEIVKFGGVIG